MSDFCEAGPYRLTHLGHRETVVDTRADAVEVLRHFPAQLHHEVTVEPMSGIKLRGDEAYRLWARCREETTDA